MRTKLKGTRERIAVFGGSFNPPHIGHTEICKWVFSLGLADRLIVVPCFIHPFGKEIEPFEHRVAMCRLAFGKLLLPISVSDIERSLGGVSLTVRTIEHLQLEHPGAQFCLITGGDIDAETSKWRNFDKIKQIVDIIRVPRGERSPIPDVSSTEVRRRLSKNENFRELVETEIAVYIVTKGLYR